MSNSESDITGDYLSASSAFPSSQEPRGGWYTDNYQVLLESALLPSDMLPFPWEPSQNTYPERHNTHDHSESPSPRPPTSQQSSHQQLPQDTIGAIDTPRVHLEIFPIDGCNAPFEPEPESPQDTAYAPVVSGASQDVDYAMRDSSETPPPVLAVQPPVVVLSETPTHPTWTTSVWPTTAQRAPEYLAALEVLQEITRPPELPAMSSCEFGNNFTLDVALNKTFSWVHGDVTRDAFSERIFTAKLSFSLTFAIGQEFQPRKKQVTVITTNNATIQQPSMGRLACLVAREMRKYLKECAKWGNPFPYTLDQIVLGAVDLVSKGTVRPRLYIRCQVAGQQAVHLNDDMQLCL